jgi:hypothetical protein
MRSSTTMEKTLETRIASKASVGRIDPQPCASRVPAWHGDLKASDPPVGDIVAPASTGLTLEF